MRKLLFVCTGNICRSPMAEGIFNDLVRKNQKETDYLATSAGIFARDGQGASQEAVEAVKDMGIDISRHSSQGVCEKLLEESDLVITMTNSHKDAIESKFFKYKDKVFAIYEYALDDEKDVNDPYGQSIAIYQKCANEIYDLISLMLKREDFI